MQPGRPLPRGLEDAGGEAGFPIRDCGAKCTTALDALVAGAGPKVITTGIQMPRSNSLMERRLATCRRELPDRTLIGNQSPLRCALEITFKADRAMRDHAGCGASS
ncbi:integrase [Streptomyces sp. NWU339]|nr:integrase [Streptomyces sp. NWU339]